TLFPLTCEEIGPAAPLTHFIERGGLPLVVDAGDDWDDVLEAYALTYLKEEIQAEALVRNLSTFSRFLQCAALANAQVTNVSAIARDAGVQRPTVQGYFQVLQDTLLATLLPAWRPRARMKEQAHSKFYWFDAGVARAMAGSLRLPVSQEARGSLLETFVLQELRAYLHYRKLAGELSYWRTPSGTEVDFVWCSAPGATPVGIEVKASKRWKTEFNKGLHALGEAAPGLTKFGIYLGDAPLAAGGVRVLPLRRFLDALYAGDILRQQ
ncbi:MAG: DUF4143 domain-containing protein, partial [Deltaproteobacteria bacterium]